MILDRGKEGERGMLASIQVHLPIKLYTCGFPES